MRYIYLVLLSFLISCRCDNTEKIHIRFKKEISSAIEKYVSKNNNHDSYLLFPSSFLFNDRKEYTGLLIGPMYEYIWDKDRIVGYFPVKGKKVYVMYDGLSFIQHETEINFCKADSINIQFGDTLISNHTPLINFIKRSFLLYYRNKNLQINTKPDTLFLPKIRQTVTISESQ